MNTILGDELPVLRLRCRRIAFGILLEQLDLPAGGLIVDLLEGELQPFEHVLARLREDPGLRTEVSDAKRFGGAGASRRDRRERTESGGGKRDDDAAAFDVHVRLPDSAISLLRWP